MSFAYFYQGGGWNENSRMDLIRALVEDHTLSIDRYHANTGDKARFGGHFYSDKAPGVSFLGAPAYALSTLFSSWFESEHHFLVFASWLVTAVVVGAATALTGALLYHAGRRLGAGPLGAIAGSIAYGLGTTAFPLSTMLFGHQVAAALLFGAFWLLWHDQDEHRPCRSLLAGLVAASAVAVEFPTAPVAAILLAYHARGPLRARRAAWYLAGCAIPAAAVGVYLTLAFESPLAVGYGLLSHPSARSAMLSHGLFGVTYPKLTVLGQLLVGRYRGLLPYSPVLVFAALGFFRREHVAERATAGAIVVYFLLFVSSYEWWQGGASFGSRHLGPMLPFLCLPLATVAERRPGLTWAATGASVAFMLVVTSVQPKPSDRISDPFFRGIWPAFVRGGVALGNICPVSGRASERGHTPFISRAPHDAFNVGMLLGGRGPKSLVPLLGFWLGAGFALWKASHPTEQKTPYPERAP